MAEEGETPCLDNSHEVFTQASHSSLPTAVLVTVTFVSNQKLLFFFSSTNDVGADGVVGSSADDQEVEFPHMELARLDEMINRPRWVVPVLHNGELEILLDASVALCKKGCHLHS